MGGGMRQTTRVLNLAGVVIWLLFLLLAGQTYFLGRLMAGNTVERPGASASELLEVFGPLVYFGICFLSTFASRRSYWLLAGGAIAHVVGGVVVSTHASPFLLVLFLALTLSWFGMYRELPAMA